MRGRGGKVGGDKGGKGGGRKFLLRPGRHGILDEKDSTNLGGVEGGGRKVEGGNRGGWGRNVRYGYLGDKFCGPGWGSQHDYKGEGSRSRGGRSMGRRREGGRGGGEGRKGGEEGEGGRSSHSHPEDTGLWFWTRWTA